MVSGTQSEKQININDLIEPIKVNEHNENLIQFKLKLNWLGYDEIRLTSYFGKFTENRIREFQNDRNLNVTGELDAETIIKIDDEFNAIDWHDINTFNSSYLKMNLIDLGFTGINMESLTTENLKAFQSYYNLPVTGNVDNITIHKINELMTSPLRLNNHNKDVIQLKTYLNQLGYGRLVITDKYGEFTERKVKEFQRDHGLPESGIAEEVTLRKIHKKIKNMPRRTFVKYNISLEEVKEKYEGVSANEISNGNPRETIDPEIIYNDRKQRFQFLDLRKTNVVSAPILNRFLRDKGVLKGQAETFIEAAKESRINELYLVAYAITRTNAIPQLAKAIQVNSKDIENVDGTSKVYNVYGLGSKDSLSAITDFAYSKGWDSPEKAIREGAKILQKERELRKYMTLYNKKWNPNFIIQNGKFEVVSEERLVWIDKLVNQLYEIHNKIDSYNLYLNIPRFAE